MLIMFSGICLSCKDAPEGSGSLAYSNPLSIQDDFSSKPTVPIVHEPNKSTVTIGTAVYIVKIADDNLTRGKGLSGQLSLPDDHGMLFIFDNPAIQTFWMKDMLFPIDIVWISETCLVASITPNIPIPLESTDINRLPRYQSDRPVKYVLEIAQGQAKVWDIKVGDSVLLHGTHKIPVGC